MSPRLHQGQLRKLEKHYVGCVSSISVFPNESSRWIWAQKVGKLGLEEGRHRQRPGHLQGLNGNVNWGYHGMGIKSVSTLLSDRSDQLSNSGTQDLLAALRFDILRPRLVFPWFPWEKGPRLAPQAFWLQAAILGYRICQNHMSPTPQLILLHTYILIPSILYL